MAASSSCLWLSFLSRDTRYTERKDLRVETRKVWLRDCVIRMNCDKKDDHIRMRFMGVFLVHMEVFNAGLVVLLKKNHTIQKQQN